MKTILKTFAIALVFISSFSCKNDSDKEEKDVLHKNPVAENYNISANSSDIDHPIPI